ncbi:hypothetical protein [Paludisphaera borealis]|uniref:Uncharacterized protein n=1 Tax=Paludisphaera borealis TaxID=1387353 RepID=A0A1U7CTS4_9BACT|nr:hypothetical protein [Paludisphaera borealis]APW62308.1 hypothetical protein BSF38_03847 [Paludisphaera borealis]
MVPLGCVKRHVEGDTSTYTIETWLIAVVALAAASACVAGWYIRKKRKWLGSIVLGGGVLVLCTTVPGLSVSRTTIDPNHVEWNRGFNYFNFQFDELGGIEHTVKKIPIGRTVQDVHYLDFTKKTGERVHIQVNPGSDRFLQDAIPEIISRAKERGVPCTEEAPN